ncbi:hypothetical protein E4U21_003119 [Claviceps maximensis]|nr:hypothetical protein E4U21_003119 [Claviceps maximensis]
MSQNAPQHGLPPASDTHNSSDVPAIDLVAASGNRWDDSNRSYASPSSSPTSPSSVVSQQSLSSTTGRLINVPSLTSVGALPRSGQRSLRPSIPSPLSATSNVATTLSSASPSEPAAFWTQQTSQSTGHKATEKPFIKAPIGQTASYSEPSSPFRLEEEIQRLRVLIHLNKGRSFSDPEGSTTTHSHPTSTELTTTATTMPPSSAKNKTQKLPQTLSTHDTSPSSSPFKQGSKNKAGLREAQNSTDIASIIEAAGSPEAVIQYLLKEKHAQSQQNSQLWRLVDKQRAMILGLQKDLEAALKDKEKYRKKLKDMWSNPAIVQAASVKQGEVSRATTEHGARSPQIEVPESRAHTASSQGPESPSLDSDSQMNSPTDISIAPYPITPPADKPLVSPYAVCEARDTKNALPKQQQHLPSGFNHETNDNKYAVTRVRQDEDQDQIQDQSREPQHSISLQPTQSPPTNLSKSPPPKPPAASLPPSVVESSSLEEKGLDQFPCPPRKAPPAPLQLGQQIKRNLAISGTEDENDSNSDYDEADEIVMDENRGRRKTRDDDDKEREVVAFREAQRRSSSAQLRSASPSRRSLHQQPVLPSSLPVDAEQKTISSVDALPLRTHAVPPRLALGLPSNPRPLSNIQHSASAPLSARLGSAAPFSPRPPRQQMAYTSSIAPLVSTPPAESPDFSLAAVRPSPAERTKIYTGLVTEEYPDLLLPPNALPSIEVKVASSRMKPSRASILTLTQLEEDPVFTLAVLSRADHGELWRAEKDIASLGKLDVRMRNCIAFNAKIPERSLFSGHAPAKLDARRVALEQYMEELLNTPFDTATATELCKYLSSNILPPNVEETDSYFGLAHENNALKAGIDGRSFRSGYLTKKGKNFGGWKARFFVLDGPLLKYYETTGGTHLGTIKLHNAQIGKQSSNYNNENHSPARQTSAEDLDNQYRHAFIILEPKKKDSNAHVKHVLCAESDNERDLWVDVLQQWADSRDTEDAEPPPSFAPPLSSAPPLASNAAHERQASSGAADNASGPRPTKKSQQVRAHNHQHEDSGTLIGVRYDSTHAGEAPHKGAAALSDLPGLTSPQGIAYETMSSQANKLISGPKDPQIISDSAAWGNKQGLGIPLADEKKQRKRSFFGFGPKTRLSSDGQDSVFGGSDNGCANGGQQFSGSSHTHSHSGPVRHVFGATLAEAARYNPPADVNVPLPSVVYRCIQYLDFKEATAEEGIFRVSGSNVVIKQLRERFNMESDVNLITDEQYYDIHAVASLLKLYLRELPTTILTKDLHLDFLSTNEIQDRQEKIAKLAELAQLLPLANATLLKYLIAFLLRIINNSAVNKMNARNVGIVFSPTLNIPAQVFAMFLQSYQGIFGVGPEEYELPLFSSEYDCYENADGAASQQQQQQQHDHHQQHDQQQHHHSYQHPQQQYQQQQHHLYQSQNQHPQQQQQHHSYQNQHEHQHPPPQQQRLEAPRQPSTSSASASSHQQPRLDYVRADSRSTPTPPLISTMQNTRSTPTPPFGSPSAYESSRAVPETHDGQSYHPAQRAVAGYDRSQYQSCNGDQGSVEAQMNAQARRRESSMMMGAMMNPPHQASKSRLREATRY